MKIIIKLATTAFGIAFTATVFPAAAQSVPSSNVSIYGLIDEYVGSMRRSDQSGRTTALSSGGMATSFWGIRGREDLGGGLYAMFSLESFFQADTGVPGRTTADPFFSKNSWVGLGGRFGQVTAGRQTNPLFLATGNFNPFGTSLQLSPIMLQTWSPNYNRNVLGDSVWDNSVQYNSPTVGGARVSALYSFGEVASNDGVRNFNLSGNYSNGPFSAVASAQQVKVGAGITGAVGSQKEALVGASYMFKFARVYATLNGTWTPDVKTKTATTQFGTTIPVGFGNVLASIAHTDRDVGVASTMRNTSALGYGYDLSKRTDLYAIYLRDRATGYGSEGSLALGIRHRF